MTWLVLGENLAGTSHLAQGVPCQDEFRFHTFGPAEEWLVIAVADGAGSATHSQLGSRLVCDTFRETIDANNVEHLLCQESILALFDEARNGLLVEAERIGVPIRELACTALLAIVGEHQAAFAQLGDGAIVVDTDGDFQTIFWPEPGEYANVTEFLTDDNFANHLLFETTEANISEIAVFTDGLQRLALDFTDRKAHADFFRPLFGAMRKAETLELLREPFRQFLTSERVNARTDDDKTLVCAIRHP